MICFLGRMGGTGETASATSDISTASGRLNAQAIAAATTGMTTFIASAERTSSLGRRRRLVASANRGLEADREHGKDDAGFERQKNQALQGHGSLGLSRRRGGGKRKGGAFAWRGHTRLQPGSTRYAHEPARSALTTTMRLAPFHRPIKCVPVGDLDEGPTAVESRKGRKLRRSVLRPEEITQGGLDELGHCSPLARRLAFELVMTVASIFSVVFIWKTISTIWRPVVSQFENRKA